MNKQDIGRQLKHFRQIAGLTQEALAEKVNIHEKQISRIEAGIHFPTFDNFMKILNALDIEMKDFSTSDEPKFNKTEDKIMKIVKKSTEKELELYLLIIENIKKHINN